LKKYFLNKKRKTEENTEDSFFELVNIGTKIRTYTDVRRETSLFDKGSYKLPLKLLLAYDK